MKGLLVLTALLLSACQLKESVAPTYQATVGPSATERYRFEIELPYTHEVQGGNIHMPWDVAKHTTQKSHWLYTNALEGTVKAEDFAFCTSRCNESRVSRQMLIEGSITFKGKTLLINITNPDSSEGYLHLTAFNGEWRLSER